MTAAETLAKLSAPFPADAISWRAGPVSNSKTKPLAYLDARDVAARLDAVMGADWQCEYVPMPNGTCCCRIGLKIDGEWRWRSNGAGDTQVEAEKGQYSGAFKRAAVMWGVGAYLYNVSAPWVAMEGKNIAPGEYAKLEALLRRQGAPASAPEQPPPPAPEKPSREALQSSQAPLTDPKMEALQRREAAAKRAEEVKASTLLEAHKTAQSLLEGARERYRELVGGSGAAEIERQHNVWKQTVKAAKRRFTPEDQQSLVKAERSLDDAIRAKLASPAADPETGEIAA